MKKNAQNCGQKFTGFLFGLWFPVFALASLGLRSSSFDPTRRRGTQGSKVQGLLVVG
jgi:hypothetical protein